MVSTESRGQRLRGCREAADLSGDEVSDEIGVTRGQLYRYERDESEPPNDVLLKLSRLYGVTTDFLLTGSD